MKRLISGLIASAITFSMFTAVYAEETAISLTNKTKSGSNAYNNTNLYTNAFDGNTTSFFDGLTGGWCQVDLGGQYDISKIRFYPRSGRSETKPSEYVVRMNNGYFSASVDGDVWETIYTVPADFCTVTDDKSYLKWYETEITGTYRYVKYQNDKNAANIAEIEVYGTYNKEASESTTQAPTEPPAPTEEPLSNDFVILDRTGWSVSTNSQQSSSGNNSAAMVLDGNESTIWHSRYSGTITNTPENDPIYLEINTGKVQSISGISYTPRKKDSSSGSINGVITAYEVYTSSDGKAWTKTAEGNLGYTANDETQNSKDIIFSPTDTQYIRLVALDNLTNGNQYVASCAELNLYTYTGGESEHPITSAVSDLSEVESKIQAINTTHVIKDSLLTKTTELKTAGSVDGIENFIAATEKITDALSWMESGINDVYISRIMDILVDADISASAITVANDELAGFYNTGNAAKENLNAIWQDEFTMSEEEYELPLYARIESAITRAKARIDSNDGNDYIMLKELVSYISGKYEYAGNENSFGRNAGECEAVVSNINFTLKNLDTDVETELTTYKSGEIWLDTLGSKISAHGGQIIKQGDTYYWYGEDNKISYYLTTGVSCYSSKDLMNWKYEGLAFKVFDDGTESKQFTDEFMTDSILGTKGRIERPKVIYNESTGKYVMWMHLEKNGDYTLSIAGVAIADSPTGPFKWLWYGRPVHDSYVIMNEDYSQTFRDMNLFVDDDKKAYVFYSSENNQVMYAVQLNDEYTWINDSGLDIANIETLKAEIIDNTATFTVPDNETRILYGYLAAYDSNNALTGLKMAKLTAGEQNLSVEAANAAAYKAFIWTDKQKPAITVRTPEGSSEGEVIVPDMREITSAKYTYGKTSFTRYQLASGGAMPLEKSSDDNTVYVSTRKDGRIYSTEYPKTGRWSRVGQNAADVNCDETITTTTTNNNTTLRREAPAPIKIDGKYYMVTSALSGWRANPSLTQVSDSILGEWTPTGNPMTGAGPVNNGKWSQDAAIGTSFNSQSTCVIELPNGSYMYMGDRWKNGVYETSNTLGTFADVDVKASTYVWLPITFETDSTYGDNTLKVRWSDSWAYNNLAQAKENLKIHSATPYVYGNLYLPTSADGEITVTWSSSDESIITKTGEVTRQTEDTKVTLTATLSNSSGETAEKVFNLNVKAKSKERNDEAYLFVHFKDGTDTVNNEQIYFSLSTDGLNWERVNAGKPILTSSMGTGGLRDPHIVRSPEGDKYFMIATDLSIHKNSNWSTASNNGSKSIMVWESTDLVNWTEQRMVEIAPDNAGCAWAPESIYNKETGAYMVFWASKTDGKQKIYCSETRDFVNFTAPQMYIEKQADIIDTTIIEENGTYYRFSKDETDKNVMLEKGESLYGEFTKLENFSIPTCEGPTVFKLNGEEKWELLVDFYAGSGYSAYTSNDISSGVFTKENSYSTPYTFRHGTVIPITMDEYNAIKEAYNPPVIFNDDAEPSTINIPEAAQDKPVIYYDFEDIANGVITDKSGNGNNAALHSGGEVSDNPISGYGDALMLDNAGYIKLPDNITDNIEDFSISMKINIKERGSGTHNKKLFNFGNKIYFVPQGNSSYAYHMYTKFGNSTVTSSATQLAMDTANPNNWSELTIVKSGTFIRMYVNGVLDEEATVADTTESLGVLNSNTIGSNITLNIDEFKLYNRALSYKEVTGEEEPELSYQ